MCDNTIEKQLKIADWYDAPHGRGFMQKHKDIFLFYSLRLSLWNPANYPSISLYIRVTKIKQKVIGYPSHILITPYTSFICMNKRLCQKFQSTSTRPGGSLRNFSLICRRHHYRWRRLNYTRYSWPLSCSEHSLACHTYCDMGHPFMIVIS